MDQLELARRDARKAKAAGAICEPTRPPNLRGPFAAGMSLQSDVVSAVVKQITGYDALTVGRWNL
jgi:hypothetical protein